MKILGVIPARGGSKGIPHKNIAVLSGKPLLTYTMEAALASGVLTDLVVSSDDETIIRVAKEAGAVRCDEQDQSGEKSGRDDLHLRVIRRPADISGDTASTESALLHALDVMEGRIHATYDAVMTLQPTSPFRTPESIRAFARQFERDIDRFDALLTLHENKADHWVYDKEQGAYRRLYPDAPRRRQERDPLYIENSALYLTSVQALRETGSVLGHHVNGFVISEKEGTDINEPVDLTIAEGLMRGA